MHLQEQIVALKQVVVDAATQLETFRILHPNLRHNRVRRATLRDDYNTARMTLRAARIEARIQYLRKHSRRIA